MATTPSGLSNPASTGGAGVTFEARVQAAHLLAMLVGGPAPGMSEGSVVQLQFQAKVHGYMLDDLVCHSRLQNSSTAKALVQIKRTLTGV